MAPQLVAGNRENRHCRMVTSRAPANHVILSCRLI